MHTSSFSLSLLYIYIYTHIAIYVYINGPGVYEPCPTWESFIVSSCSLTCHAGDANIYMYMLSLSIYICRVNPRRAAAYCSPAACRRHRAEEREREERERRAYHRHPGVRERALCAFVWVGARMTVAAETEGRLWVSAHNR